PGSIVVAAVNAGEEYQLTELDPALVSRFNLYEFAPTVEDWLLWASEQDIDVRVLTFIQQHPEHLDGDNLDADTAIATAGLVKTPDRRAWAKVSDFVRNHQNLADIHFKLIAGMVGSRATLAFRQSLTQQRGLTPEQLLLQFSKQRTKLKNLDIQDFASLNEQVLLWLNTGKCPDKKADNARKNLLNYLQYLRKAKQQEAIAHFSSLVQSPKFSDAMAFVAESMDLVDFLSEYLEAINV
ncbi:MAG: AAA family ATPase, partial [Spirulinaceae cyanobacterium]